jgi:hypothetical protein
MSTEVVHEIELLPCRKGCVQDFIEKKGLFEAAFAEEVEIEPDNSDVS